MITGILLEQATGRPLHELYHELVLDPLGMDGTWLEGHEQPRESEVAHHYPTTSTGRRPDDRLGRRGLVTTAPGVDPFRTGALVGTSH